MALVAVRDIDPRPRALTLQGRATFTHEASATPNIVLQDSSTSIALGVERVLWRFPAGSGIAPGDSLVGPRQTISIAQPGRYRVRVRVQDSTQAYSDTAFTLIITPATVGVRPDGTPALWAWPNPAEGGRTQLEGLLPHQEATLTDALGRTLRRWHPTTDTEPLDLAGLPAGVYLLRQASRTLRLANP